MPTRKKRFRVRTSKSYPDKWRIVDYGDGKQTIADDLERKEALSLEYKMNRQEGYYQ